MVDYFSRKPYSKKVQNGWENKKYGLLLYDAPSGGLLVTWVILTSIYPFMDVSTLIVMLEQTHGCVYFLFNVIAKASLKEWILEV